MRLQDGRLDGGLVRGLGDEVAREATHLALGQSSAHEHALLPVLALVDRGAERIQLGELPALLIGQQQADIDETVGKALRDPLAQRVDPRTRRRRDLKRSGKAIRQAAPAERIEPVDLVQDELEGHLIRTDLGQHGVHGSDHLLELLVTHRGIHDVQDQIRDERLFERRREALNELGRQPADEADGVRDEVALAVVLEAPRRRVERLEEPVVDRHVRVRERVQERRLTDVRVAREGDRGNLRPLALLAPQSPLLLDLLEPAAEHDDPPVREPAVGFQLRLARPTRADAGSYRPGAPAEPLEVLPHPAHPGQVVLELRELDLELALGARGVLGKDVEDQLRPVHHPSVERVLERPLLGRIELAVDEEHVRLGPRVLRLQLLELPLADVGARIGTGALLHQLRDGLDECRPGELLQLGQLVVGVGALREECQHEPPLGLSARLRFWLTRRHAVDCATLAAVPPAADSDLARRLAARTLELIDIASESRNEAEIASYVEDAVGEPTWRDGETLWYGASSGGRPLVVLAGHLDTVPAQDNIPGQLTNTEVVGLGASDMKAGVAVMIELARAWRELHATQRLDLNFLFFPREELPASESALPHFFDSVPRVHEAELAILLEPTDCTIQAGCLGNLNAQLVFHGVSGHSARPWTAENAIERALEGLRPLAAIEPRPVQVGGLTFTEVLSLTRIEGGIADNVIPDRVTAHVNFRYAPDRSPESAEAHLRGLVPSGADYVPAGDSPPARVVTDSPLVQQLRAAGDLALEPKQAWTNVADFTARGIDAVNFGPGAPRYAHRRDERVEIAALVKAYESLWAFLVGTV